MLLDIAGAINALPAPALMERATAGVSRIGPRAFTPTVAVALTLCAVYPLPNLAPTRDLTGQILTTTGQTGGVSRVMGRHGTARLRWGVCGVQGPSPSDGQSGGSPFMAQVRPIFLMRGARAAIMPPLPMVPSTGIPRSCSRREPRTTFLPHRCYGWASRIPRNSFKKGHGGGTMAQCCAVGPTGRL